MTSTPPGRSDDEIARQYHRQMLAIALAVVLLSFLLEVRADQRVNPRGFQNFPVPETCPSRSWFGTKCPGCGLTRSFIYLAEGDWRASLAMHRIGWLMALAVLIQFPYRIFALRGGQATASLRFAARWFGYFLIVMLLGNWLLEMLAR